MYGRVYRELHLHCNTKSSGLGFSPRLSSQACSKGHRVPRVSAASGPIEVVQECLTALRKADIERFQAHFAPDTIGLGTSVRKVVLLGGKAFVEDGPLALFIDVLDVGARRVLPAHLLRRSQGISALQTGPASYMQRTAVTARSGEEAVLEWALAKHAQRWCVSSVRRDPATDHPLPQEPHPRCSPESVVLAILAALQEGDVQQALRFFMWPGARTDVQLPFLQRSFKEGSKRMLLHHGKAELCDASLASPQLFTQEVRVVLDSTSAQEWGQTHATSLWHMCMRDNGKWMCRDIERAA